MRHWLVAVGLAVLLVPCAASVRAEPPSKNALDVVSFAIKIDGLGLDQDTAFFKSVGGLKVETEVVEFQEGGETGGVRKAPGRTKFGNLVLKRPFLGENGKDPIQQWVRAVEDGQVVRKKVTVIYYRKNLVEVARYELSQCFPVRWEIGELDPSKNDPAIESIEIAHEGLTMVPPQPQPQ